MQRQKATVTNENERLKTDKARLFVAAAVPDEIKNLIIENIKIYTGYTKRVVSADNWHITCLWLGEIDNWQQEADDITANMTQTFLPTVTLTHIGRGTGTKEGQLWVFAKPTALLGSIRQQLQERVKRCLPGWSRAQSQGLFVPHIRLADLRERSVSKFVADCPLVAVWRVKKLLLMRSRMDYQGLKYDMVGEISLEN